MNADMTPLRWFVATCVAAMAAALTATLIVCAAAGRGAPVALVFSPGILLIALMFTAPHALVLGLFGIALRGRLRWWLAMPAGAVIGVGPIAFLLRHGFSSPLPTARTELATILTFCAVCGAVGGLAFWNQVQRTGS